MISVQCLKKCRTTVSSLLHPADDATTAHFALKKKWIRLSSWERVSKFPWPFEMIKFDFLYSFVNYSEQ
jgi:hypothetical protein